MSGRGEAIIQIDIDGEEVHAHRWNSAVFTFIGELAAYNHVFVGTEDAENGGTIGHYIFRTYPHYKDIIKFMLLEKFPMHINLTEVADCDSREFNRQHYDDVRHEDSFPEEWGD